MQFLFWHYIFLRVFYENPKHKLTNKTISRNQKIKWKITSKCTRKNFKCAWLAQSLQNFASGQDFEKTIITSCRFYWEKLLVFNLKCLFKTFLKIYIDDFNIVHNNENKLFCSEQQPDSRFDVPTQNIVTYLNFSK